jgi:hypothetical protein
MSSPTPPYSGALVRRDIRRGLRQVILGATAAGARVYLSRIFPLALHDADGTLRQDVLPAILVYAGDEDLEEYNAAPLETERTLQLWVDIVMQLREDFDDVVDFISGQVEAAVEQDETLGDRCEHVRLRFVARPLEPIRDGAITLSSLRLRFDAVYHVQRDDSITLEDLNTVAVEWDLAPPDAAIEATDTLDLTPP